MIEILTVPARRQRIHLSGAVRLVALMATWSGLSPRGPGRLLGAYPARIRARRGVHAGPPAGRHGARPDHCHSPCAANGAGRPAHPRARRAAPGRDLLINYFWLHWVYLGCFWGVTMIIVITVWLRVLRVPSVGFCMLVWGDPGTSFRGICRSDLLGGAVPCRRHRHTESAIGCRFPQEHGAGAVVSHNCLIVPA
jgi:hypothetical protein